MLTGQSHLTTKLTKITKVFWELLRGLRGLRGEKSSRSWRVALAGVVTAATVVTIAAQNPPPTPPQNPPAAPQPATPGRGGGGGRGRGAVQVMTLATTAWSDGASIPLKHSQAGDEVSPPLAWSNVPDGAASFVLIVHDLDARTAGGVDDLLHWMVWNIPGASTSLPEGVPQAPQLPDGSRQISASGPYYRGPAAPASGPPHHYAFELFALDTMLDVQPVGASPAETRAAVVAAMAGHVRGKATCFGSFRRPGAGAGRPAAAAGRPGA